MAPASAESIRQATKKVLASEEYHLDLKENSLQPLWERVLEMLRSFLNFISDMFSFLDGMPQFVRWLVILAMFVVVILLVGHIVMALISAVRPAKNRKAGSFGSVETRDDPRRWEQEAFQKAKMGDYVVAARLLLLASLFRLEDSFDRPFRRSTTNREYLRKYRTLPVLDSVRQLVDTIDRKWYGEEPCDQQDFEQCRRSHMLIIQLVQSRRGSRQEFV